jgi:lipoprotein-releasing system permease protein
LAGAGLVLGVGLLIVVSSVMNGFDRELRATILSVVPHIQLVHQTGVDDWQSERQKILLLDEVTQAVPYNQVKGLISKSAIARPVQLLGLSSEAMPAGLNSVLEKYSLKMPNSGGILLSEVVAQALNVKQNQRVSIIVPSIKGTAGSVQSFVVEGIFATHTEIDQSLALASLSQVGNIAGKEDQVTGFRLQIKDQFNARKVGMSIIRDLPFGYGFRDWFQTHGNLYQAIQLSRNMVSLLIFLIVAIAAFNVVSMLMMTVINKRKDIAVLQTLGLSRLNIICLFLMQGSMIGFVGISFGALLGIFGSYWVADFVIFLESFFGQQLLNTEVYPIDYIPVDLRWSNVAGISLIAMLLNTTATIYPALRASRSVPADELRYE